MEVKFGKLSSNLLAQTTSAPAEENFFATSKNSNSSQQPAGQNHPTSIRLNDYDSNILENNAYQNLEDDMLKIEHKIEIIENSIAKINSEIEAFEEFGDIFQVNQLKIRKQALEKELKESNKKYSELGLSAKISGQIASVVNFTSNKKTNTLSKTKDFISRKILAKISKKFNDNQKMKDALDTLFNINSNVDELITMQTPYGETIGRYEKLTAYLNKANVIHSQIAKNIKKIK